MLLRHGPVGGVYMCASESAGGFLYFLWYFSDGCISCLLICSLLLFSLAYVLVYSFFF